MRYESRGLRFRKALVPALIIAGAASLLALIAGVAVAQVAAPAIAGAAREGKAGTQVAGEEGGGSGSVDARGAGAGPTGSGDVDGLLPDGTTPFDDAQPGVTGLAPELLSALREAARAAEAEGITMTVTSGWRSPAYQQQLRVDAIAEYGSEAEAARWVASRRSPCTSLAKRSTSGRGTRRNGSPTMEPSLASARCMTMSRGTSSCVPTLRQPAVPSSTGIRATTRDCSNHACHGSHGASPERASVQKDRRCTRTRAGRREPRSERQSLARITQL
ncbi:D-alanyl-D-alanine carboxypeptidase family protein [Leucobacter luti]|uniref:D-alanyl-D-alanine carboxypeptidase family protein n=1 Tax=Leucobacter luti TaxID=340320 RepID=UPI00215D9687|nr:D-alanyl-D-alanine carboxypeptidase family protein [Leucobacter luti]